MLAVLASRACNIPLMRHQAAWIFGAICPARDTGVALVMPDASTEAMQALLQELSTRLCQAKSPRGLIGR